MLSQQGKLLGLGRRLEPDEPAIADSMLCAELGDPFERPFGYGRRQVRAVALGSLVAGHELRPVLGEDGHEVLASAGTKVQQPAPQSRRTRLARGLDDGLEPVGPIRQAGKDGSHADVGLDARRDQLIDSGTGRQEGQQRLLASRVTLCRCRALCPILSNTMARDSVVHLRPRHSSRQGSLPPLSLPALLQ